MKRFLQRLCHSRLRSLECMVYAMSLFVIFGVFYSLGQLHLQQQFYRGLGQPGHQIPDGRKMLSFFRRSSGNSEEDPQDNKVVGRYGWRDKPYAISQERWKALLQNDIPDDSASSMASADHGTMLDEIDGYNPFVSIEDIPQDKKVPLSSQQRSQQEDSLRSSLNDLIYPQQPVKRQGYDQEGHVVFEGPPANIQNDLAAKSQKANPVPALPGIEVHESFLVHKIHPKDSSQDTTNEEKHQRKGTGVNILQDEVEVGDSANGKEIKDSEIDSPWFNAAKDPNIDHGGFARQVEVVPHDVNARMEARDSVNIATNSEKAIQWQQQPFVDQEGKNTQQRNKGPPKQPLKSIKQYISGNQYIGHQSDRHGETDSNTNSDQKVVKQNNNDNRHHGVYHSQPRVGNQVDNFQQQQQQQPQQQQKQYHGNKRLPNQRQRRGYYHDKHDVIKRDVSGIGIHPGGSVARDKQGAAGQSPSSTDAGHYGSKGVVMESKQMPSWQVLAKIEQDLEAEGHKMQMQMLRYVMHNTTKEEGGQVQPPRVQGLQVNRPNNNGQQVIIVPQSSPYQSNSGVNTQYNEVLKQKLKNVNSEGQQAPDIDATNQYISERDALKSRVREIVKNQQIKSHNKTRLTSSTHHHHSHHHHHHHNTNNHDQAHNNQDKAIPMVNYAEETLAKAKTANAEAMRQFDVHNSTSKSYHPHEILYEDKLLAQQPKIYMALLGRMGNHLFHLASLYGIARKTQHAPVVSPGAYILEAFDARIKDVFMVDEPPSNILTIHEEGSGVFTTKVYNLPPNTDIQLCCYFQSWRYFVEYSDELRQIFTFKPWITARAQSILSMAKRDYMTMQFGGQLPKHISHTVTYVGVHVRRSDHLLTEHLKKGYKPASLTYFNKAMDYYRQKYANVYFIVCSDEIEWAKDHLRDKDVYFVEGQDGLVDLGVLAACNHTVTSVGTFSWWAGWLAGGEVTYYSDWPMPGTEIDKNYEHYDYFMPHWKPFGD